MKREAIKRWIWEHMHESISDTIETLNVETGRTLQIITGYTGIIIGFAKVL